MTNDPGRQGDLFALPVAGAQREKRSRMGRPHAPNKPTGAEHATAHTGRLTPEQVADRERLRVRLERVALLYVASATGGPFTLADVREAAERLGVLTGEEGRPDVATGRLARPRELAWLGALLPGMARRGLLERYTIAGRVQYDTSEGKRAHGNKNVLWQLTGAGFDAVARLRDSLP